MKATILFLKFLASAKGHPRLKAWRRACLVRGAMSDPWKRGEARGSARGAYMPEENLVIVTVRDKHPQYYTGMLDGSPRFGPKHKAVRLSDDLCGKCVSQLMSGWKIECHAMNGLVRFGAKPKDGA